MLFLVRHGQTQENAAGLVQGQMDGTLSKVGMEEVRALAYVLREDTFDRVYSSDLLRARQTAEILVEQLDCNGLLTDPRLREQGFGIYEGKPLFRLLRKLRDERTQISDFTPEGGETPSDFIFRVREFYTECLSKSFDGANLMVVTHYGVIRILLEELMGISAAQESIHNASYYKIDNCSRGGFRIVHSGR